MFYGLELQVGFKSHLRIYFSYARDQVLMNTPLRVSHCFMRSDHRYWIRIRKNVRGCDQKFNSPVLALWWYMEKWGLWMMLREGKYRSIPGNKQGSRCQSISADLRAWRGEEAFSKPTTSDVCVSGHFYRSKAVNVRVSCLLRRWGPLTLLRNRKDLENWRDPVRSLLNLRV